MSLSNPTLTNPAQFFFEWKNGHLEYYDKEKGERIQVPLPFQFIVLDQLNGVTGWSDADESGIWSNETRSMREDFTVRTKKRVLYVGSYKDDKGINQVSGFGGKYCKIVYFALKMKTGDWSMNRLKLTGAALNAWIDFNSHYNPENGKVKITGSTDAQKGATSYTVPTFEYGHFEGDEFDIACDLDRQLQTYLHQALAAPKYDGEATEDAYENLKATPEEVAEFEAKKREGKTEPDKIQEVNDLFDDPISLDEIPF